MVRSLEESVGSLLGFRLTRRNCLKGLLTGWGLCLAIPRTKVIATPNTCYDTIVDRFVGEELTYQVGFWLISRCGEAKTSLVETQGPGIYRATLEGRTLGVTRVLVGRYRYSCVSLMKLSEDGHCFRPLRFELTKGREGREAQSAVRFDYSAKELFYTRTDPDGAFQEHSKPMQEGTVYEDYLTLFYNFRHGCYGPLERGRSYLLPLHIHEDMNTLQLSIASQEEEEKQRQRELDKEGKDLFLRFRVKGEDVSSTSGEIEGWLSLDGVPTKGKIRDVVLLGDLWGDLVHREFKFSPRGT